MTHFVSPCSPQPRGLRRSFAARVAGRARAWLLARLPAVEFISQAEEDRRLEELQGLR